jgi:Domain of unknown function (DUF5615)
MAGLGIRLYTDEMIPTTLAVQLRGRGYNVESCEEAGRSRQRIPDHDQLEYATRNGRAILTYNIADFPRIDAMWKAAGRRHGGIILSPEVGDFGTLLRRVQAHLDSHPPEVQENLLMWLTPIP